MAKYIVRYGIMRFLGLFSARGSDRYARGDRVIARTPRGLEVGEVLAVADESSESHLKDAPGGQLLRVMSSDDEHEWSILNEKLAETFQTCQAHVRQLGLSMELVDVEHVFGGERLIVYYLAEKRVDFRQLVRQLAGEFQTRIEMRQIGVRDEAKLLADYGDCGKPVCCNTHLSAMPPVSMKMAKLQKATLDPTKISGRCGRLKCCLRYEFDTYEQIAKELPPIGADVVTREGRARVLSHEIIAEQLLVQTEDHRRMVIDAAEVLSVIKLPSRQNRNQRSRKNPRREYRS